MGLYKLKAGSHATGSLADADGNNTLQVYDAKGPNNIIESDQELDVEDPTRFERYDGPAPQRQRPGAMSGLSPVLNAPLPPGPPTDMDRAEAEMMRPMTVEDRRKRAEWLRQQAEALDNEAAEAERNIAVAQREQAPSKQASTEESVTTDPDSGETTKSKVPTDSEINQMTKDDLYDLGQKLDADVKAHDSRADMVKKIRAARKG